MNIDKMREENKKEKIIKHDLKDFIGGWVCGIFKPALFNLDQVEVAIKKYKKGDKENSHTHKIAVEYTIIASGKVKMNNQIYKTDDIIEIRPGEYTNFEALKNTITVVIKTPSVLGDKYVL